MLYLSSDSACSGSVVQPILLAIAQQSHNRSEVYNQKAKLSLG